MSRKAQIRALDAAHTSGLSPADAAAALNAPIPGRKSVPHNEFVAYLYDNGIFDAVLVAASGGDAVAQGTIGKLDYAIKFGLTSIDMDSPSTVASLDMLVAAGHMTAEQKTALIALGDTSTTLAGSLGEISQHDIEEAR